MKFEIKKAGNYFVAHDVTDKKKTYGKINIQLESLLAIHVV